MKTTDYDWLVAGSVLYGEGFIDLDDCRLSSRFQSPHKICEKRDLFVKTLSDDAKKMIMEILTGPEELFRDICATAKGPRGIGRQRFATVIRKHYGYTFSQGFSIYGEIKKFVREVVQ